MLQDGDVRVRIFPEGEEVLLGRLSLCGVALHDIGSADLETRERAGGRVQHNPTMVEDFLKLDYGFGPLLSSTPSRANKQ